MPSQLHFSSMIKIAQGSHLNRQLFMMRFQELVHSRPWKFHVEINAETGTSSEKIREPPNARAGRNPQIPQNQLTPLMVEDINTSLKVREDTWDVQVPTIGQMSHARTQVSWHSHHAPQYLSSSLPITKSLSLLNKLAWHWWPQTLPTCFNQQIRRSPGRVRCPFPCKY